MSSPISDGIYNIYNVQFPSSVINLSGGFQYATINGYTPPSGTAPNLRWIVKNVGNGQITLESFPTRGFYASVAHFARGAPTFSSPTPVFWSVRQVAPGIYNLETQGFQLALAEGGRLAVIVLGPLRDTSTPQEQQWRFERVGN